VGADLFLRRRRPGLREVLLPRARTDFRLRACRKASAWVILHPPPPPPRSQSAGLDACTARWPTSFDSRWCPDGWLDLPDGARSLVGSADAAILFWARSLVRTVLGWRVLTASVECPISRHRVLAVRGGHAEVSIDGRTAPRPGNNSTVIR